MLLRKTGKQNEAELAFNEAEGLLSEAVAEEAMTCERNVHWARH